MSMVAKKKKDKTGSLLLINGDEAVVVVVRSAPVDRLFSKAEAFAECDTTITERMRDVAPDEGGPFFMIVEHATGETRAFVLYEEPGFRQDSVGVSYV